MTQPWDSCSPITILKVLLIFEPGVSHFCLHWMPHPCGCWPAPCGTLSNLQKSVALIFQGRQDSGASDSSGTAGFSNLQLPVSGFAFDCNVTLLLTGQGSQPSLIGALMMLCQGPRAPPGGKRLRPGSKFHSGVSYQGPSLQNDKTLFTSAMFAAGPKEHPVG